jgi:indole-3-glycerol phosphate synthase
MMNILDKIVVRKKEEVAARKKELPMERLVDEIHYHRTGISLMNIFNQQNSKGIIAEFKRRSPSKGIINDRMDPLAVTTAYQSGGASAVSILTDNDFFGGSVDDVLKCRESLSIPILRKEFIVDPYQIHEAKAIGADLILLIAACLTPSQVMGFSAEARSIGLEVLLELHDEDEIGHICSTVDLVGINNRSLKTFDVDIARSLRMANAIPEGKPKVAESGIDDPEQVKLFRENGYKGFLIGESFMKQTNPGEALKQFISKL